MPEYRLNQKLGALSATLSAPRDPELARLLTSNLPFPDRDIEFTQFSVNLPAVPLLPLAAGAGGSVSLASFRTLAAALSKTGLGPDAAALLPSGEGLYRYTVACADLSATAQGGVAVPPLTGISASASGAASTVVRLAAIAAVPAAAGAADQLRPAVAGLLPPALMDSASDLEPHSLIAADLSGDLQLTAGVKLGYDLTWLRAVNAGQVHAELGARVEPQATANLSVNVSGRFLMLISRDAQNWLRLQIRKTTKRSQFFAAGVQAGGQATPPALKLQDPLAQALQAGLELANVSGVLPLADNISQTALSALEKRYSADVSYQLRAAADSQALVDCSFHLEGGAISAWKQAVQGDFTRLFAEPSSCVRVAQATLTHSLAREARIEVHLPFLDAQEWQSRVESIGKAHIEEDGNGRLVVFTVSAADRIARKNQYQSALTITGALRKEPNFTLAYTDVRKTLKPVLQSILNVYEFTEDAKSWLASLAPRDEIQTGLSLTIPGSRAAAWLSVPSDDRPALARVSGAVQRAMRRWLPYVYFSRPERYEDLAAAWPLIVYKASRPCEGKALSYDVQDEQTRMVAIQSAASSLPAELAAVHELMRQAGNTGSAGFYKPDQAGNILASVARDPRLFNSLLLADAFFIDRLVSLAKKGRETAGRNPEQALSALTQFAASLVETFHHKLKSLYGGQEFLPFGSLLFLEATAALSATPGESVPIQAILRAKTGSGPTLTFVNAHYTPAAGATPNFEPVPEILSPAPALPSPAPPLAVLDPASPTTAQPPLPPEAEALLAQLGVTREEFVQSAIALYAQVSRCRLLRKTLEEETATLDKLLKS